MDGRRLQLTAIEAPAEGGGGSRWGWRGATDQGQLLELFMAGHQHDLGRPVQLMVLGRGRRRNRHLTLLVQIQAVGGGTKLRTQDDRKIADLPPRIS